MSVCTQNVCLYGFGSCCAPLLGTRSQDPVFPSQDDQNTRVYLSVHNICLYGSGSLDRVCAPAPGPRNCMIHKLTKYRYTSLAYQ
jgi:hypothetical protein